MPKRASSKPVLICFGLFAIAFPIALVVLLSIPAVASYIANTLKVDNESFIGFTIDYISLAISIILGIIVYYQSQQINDLEVSQHDVYLGVENLDYSFDFGDYLTIDKTASNFNSAFFLSAEQKIILTNINVGSNKGKPLLFPLVFVTKNQPLIVSLSIKSIDVTVKEKNIIAYNGIHPIGGHPINTILKDDSRFIVGVGMIVPVEKSIDETNLSFLIEIENQNGHKQTIQSVVSLLRPNQESDFVITSSHSTLIK